MGAEVGDQPDGVGQVSAVRESGTAFVVHKQKGDTQGTVFGCQAQHPRLQELALSRAGGAADQRMRPLRTQVQVDRARCGLPNERTQFGRCSDQRRCGRARIIDTRREGPILTPTVDHRIRRCCHILAEQRQQGRRTRQITGR